MIAEIEVTSQLQISEIKLQNHCAIELEEAATDCFFFFLKSVGKFFCAEFAERVRKIAKTTRTN